MVRSKTPHLSGGPDDPDPRTDPYRDGRFKARSERVLRLSLEFAKRRQALNPGRAGIRPPEPAFRVSPKGCLTVYGLNRILPVSLYVDQWLLILEHQDRILQFIEDNQNELKIRAEREPDPEEAE